MQPPDEIMVDTFLPAIRQLITRELLSERFSQASTAKLLGVTQASISLYSSSGPGKAYSSLALLSVSKEDADRYVALLAEDLKRNPIDAVETLTTIWVGLLGKGAICQAHRRMYPSLADCDVCIREFGQMTSERSETISEVSRAVRLLESSPAFVTVMPEVSVNLACVAGNSDLPEDVAAIPGRIVRVKNAAKSLGQPEFGVSRHMARILLLVRRKKRDVRASINLKFDSRMRRTLKTLGLRVLEVGEYARTSNGDPTAEALSRKLLGTNGEFDVIADPGGNGIEPNVYIFAADAPDVARQAIQIAELYSGG